ncbi:MAG TPA: DUF6468 domain-containing protein [Caulobacteraceae bacterium]|jgi:hypothetical protein|nr:DUF6468 domain-containing protein [Caulobacteraceae bacterium]
MSDIGLIMNAVLGLLLLGALFLGWRLEGRLKVLRASHESFTRAVGDLDRAAARAEQGLSDLRAATDEAADTLAARIERAGHLAGRLEQLTAEAMLAETKLAAAPRPALRPAPAPQAAPRMEAAPQPAPRPAPVAEARPAQSRESAFARFAERYGARSPHSPSVLAEAAARNDLILEDDEAPSAPSARPVPAEVIARMERLRALARPPAQAPAKAVLIRAADDELFDEPAPRRAAGGYR